MLSISCTVKLSYVIIMTSFLVLLINTFWNYHKCQSMETYVRNSKMSDCSLQQYLTSGTSSVLLFSLSASDPSRICSTNIMNILQYYYGEILTRLPLVVVCARTDGAVSPGRHWTPSMQTKQLWGPLLLLQQAMLESPSSIFLESQSVFLGVSMLLYTPIDASQNLMTI